MCSALPDGDQKVAFDKFLVASHLREAADRVRRKEHRELLLKGDETLNGSKYLWLMKPERVAAFAHPKA